MFHALNRSPRGVRKRTRREAAAGCEKGCLRGQSYRRRTSRHPALRPFRGSARRGAAAAYHPAKVAAGTRLPLIASRGRGLARVSRLSPLPRRRGKLGASEASRDVERAAENSAAARRAIRYDRRRQNRLEPGGGHLARRRRVRRGVRRSQSNRRSHRALPRRPFTGDLRRMARRRARAASQCISPMPGGTRLGRAAGRRLPACDRDRAKGAGGRSVAGRYGATHHRDASRTWRSRRRAQRVRWIREAPTRRDGGRADARNGGVGRAYCARADRRRGGRRSGTAGGRKARSDSSVRRAARRDGASARDLEPGHSRTRRLRLRRRRDRDR